MSAKSPSALGTIGDAIAQKKWLVFTCTVCKTITSTAPNTLTYPLKMELRALEAVSTCPVCGAANVTGHPPQVVLTIMKKIVDND